MSYYYNRDRDLEAPWVSHYPEELEPEEDAYEEPYAVYDPD